MILDLMFATHHILRHRAWLSLHRLKCRSCRRHSSIRPSPIKFQPDWCACCTIHNKMMRPIHLFSSNEKRSPQRGGKEKGRKIQVNQYAFCGSVNMMTRMAWLGVATYRRALYAIWKMERRQRTKDQAHTNIPICSRYVFTLSIPVSYTHLTLPTILRVQI